MLALVDPVLHTKVEAPLAVRVADPPTQIVEDDALIVMEGDALTDTVNAAVAEHPLAFVPVTLYVVVEEGLTDILDDVEPVLHT
jgi:hypothetical protein